MVVRNDLGFLVAVVLFAVVISFVAFETESSDPFGLVIRLLALNGYIAIAITAIMNPFIKELTLFLKKPFLKIHHYFATAGLVLITLHPIALVLQTMYPAILLPNVQSVYLFFVYGGSVALIAIYVAFAGVLVRRKIVAYWRPIHMLMYLALFFGVVHANLLGQDLIGNIAIRVVYNVLFATVLFAFVLKRWQFYNIRQRMKQYALKRQQAVASAPP
jgi:DMSO/TMAO reductase YedYZ heme-binding membrane subunit